jgi:hypothetical protein
MQSSTYAYHLDLYMVLIFVALFYLTLLLWTLSCHVLVWSLDIITLHYI